ncbi:hypothetical protein BDV28DRAFT_144951 [Aspergillus coremiiformis]|uniref:Uncharacterized protein n=1 Tax=Aspergillus coremiiformis TaxID=138285 RepID=A0A5N6ZI66_9EURO|nr:hypothetical protein BDV28DRAFT_144951 [Aspergillus coremiiformis]
MRWTSDNDQLLLLKILETHDLSVDTKKVAEAWPGTDPSNRPTPRAITERLVKMRQMAKASNNNTEGHFSIGKGTGTSTGNTVSTPRKPRKSATTTPKTPTSGKRKHGAKSDAAIDDDGDALVKEEGEETPRKKPLRPASAGVNQGQAGVSLKAEPSDDVFMEDGSPKRVRRASALPPGMVQTYDGDDSQTELDSSVSEYLPEDSLKESEYRMPSNLHQESVKGDSPYHPPFSIQGPEDLTPITFIPSTYPLVTFRGQHVDFISLQPRQSWTRTDTLDVPSDTKKDHLQTTVKLPCWIGDNVVEPKDNEDDRLSWYGPMSNVEFAIV